MATQKSLVNDALAQSPFFYYRYQILYEGQTMLTLTPKYRYPLVGRRIGCAGVIQRCDS